MAETDKYTLDIVVDDKGTPVIKNFRQAVKNTETGVNKGTESMTGGFKRMWAQMALGQIVANTIMGALRGVGDFLVESSNLARDAVETQQKFAVVFGDVADEANASVKDLSDNWGIAKSTAEGLLSSTGDLLTGLGLTGDVALDLSETTQKLAIDLASFTNFQGGAERASLAITKAMLGERESMKLLGVVVTEKMIQERLALKGQKDLTGQALLQAKAMETLNIVVEQSKNAIGDYARTSDSFANQQREMGERIKEIQEGIGRSINEALLPVLQKMVVWLRENADAIEAFFKDVVAVIVDLVNIAVKTVGFLKDAFDFLSKNARYAISLLIPEVEKMGESMEETEERQKALHTQAGKLIEKFIDFAEAANLSKTEIHQWITAYDGISNAGEKYFTILEDIASGMMNVKGVEFDKILAGINREIKTGTDLVENIGFAWEKVQEEVDLQLWKELNNDMDTFGKQLKDGSKATNDLADSTVTLKEDLIDINKPIKDDANELENASEKAQDLANAFYLAGQVSQQLSEIIGEDLANALENMLILTASIIAGDIPGIIAGAVGLIAGLIADLGEAIFGASDEEMERRGADALGQWEEYMDNLRSIQEKGVRDFTKYLQSGLVDSDNFNAAMNITLRNFATLAQQGKSFPEIFDIMGEQFDILGEKMKELGIEGNETFNKLLEWREFTEVNKVLLNSISDLASAMEGMVAGGMIATQEAFDDFQTLAISNFDKLIAAGATEEQALLAMLPTLRILNKLQEDNNFILDDKIQKQIDLANQDNLLAETDNMKEMVRLLGLLVEHFIGLTGSIADAVDETSKLGREIDGLDRSDRGNIIPMFPGKDNIGFAGGVENFRVPPGFPRDTFKIGVSSGETLTVRAQGQSGAGGVNIIAHINVAVGGGSDPEEVGIAIGRGTVIGLKQAIRDNELGLTTEMKIGVGA